MTITAILYTSDYRDCHCERSVAISMTKGSHVSRSITTRQS